MTRSLCWSHSSWKCPRWVVHQLVHMASQQTHLVWSLIWQGRRRQGRASSCECLDERPYKDWISVGRSGSGDALSGGPTYGSGYRMQMMNYRDCVSAMRTGNDHNSVLSMNIDCVGDFESDGTAKRACEQGCYEKGPRWWHQSKTLMSSSYR